MKSIYKLVKYFVSILVLFSLSIKIYAQEEINLKEANVLGKINKKKTLQYEELKKMPRTGLYSFGFTIYNDILYIMGGDISETNIKDFNDKIYAYDFIENKWFTKKAKFPKVANNYVFSYKNYLYSFGGQKYLKGTEKQYLNNQIDIYDLNNDTIYSSTSMPHQAVNFAAIKANDNIILFGGSTKISETGQKTYIDKVSFFDMKTGFWYDLAPMPIAKETTGILVENKVYLIGGYKYKPLKTIESYNLTTGVWKNEYELPTALENPTLTTKNGIIYMYENGAFYTYDTKNKSFKKFIIKNITADNSKIIIYKNDLYLLGGANISIGDDPRKPKPNLEMGIPNGFTMDWQTKYISTLDNVYKINLKQFNTTLYK